MYLFIDKDYKIYRSDRFTKENYVLIRSGDLSMVNLKSMQGMNIDGTYSDIQEMPVPFYEAPPAS